MRREPNIVITGTPGVGKTAHCEQLALDTGLKHVAVNTFAQEHDCYDGRDEELGSWIVDEDKVRRRNYFVDSQKSSEFISRNRMASLSYRG